MTAVLSAADAPPGSRGIDEILAGARRRLVRVDPVTALAAQRAGAWLVDIRPTAQRARYGAVVGARVIERNVLEWRLDPRSPARLAGADRYDRPVIVVCQEGYTSSLAAAALQDLGLHAATDLDGGFAAWAAAGLPVIPGRGARPEPTRPPADAGVVVVDRAARTVHYGAESVDLTRREFDLLVFLAAHPRRVFGRTQLLDRIWGVGPAGDRTVDVHIRRLRARLGYDLVTTVRGVGYRLSESARVDLTGAPAIDEHERG